MSVGKPGRIGEMMLIVESERGGETELRPRAAEAERRGACRSEAERERDGLRDGRRGGGR